MEEKIFHMNVRNISRKKYVIGNRFSYATGLEIESEREDEKYHYKEKQVKDNIESEMILNKQADQKFKDPKYFFNAANNFERRSDARVFKETDIALYREFSPEENKELARRFAQELSNKYQTPISLNFHKLDSDNPHFHILHSERTVDGENFSPKKKTEYRTKEYLNDSRVMWDKHSNEYFKEKGKDLFVDHRSFEERGLEKQPLQRQNRFADPVVQKEIREYNEVIKTERKVLEVKRYKRDVKEDYYSKRIERSLHRKEVKTDMERGKEKVVTVHRLYENEIQKHQRQYVENKNQHRKQREKNKENKKEFVQRKMDYRNKKNHIKNNIRLKKEDMIDLKYKNQDLKSDLKGLSIFDRKQRRNLKRQITKNKIKMKKKKVEIKREKYKQKQNSLQLKNARNGLKKEVKKEHQFFKKKVVNKIKFKSLSREKNKVLNQKIDNSKVVSLNDFKKTNKVQKIKTADRQRAR